LTARVKALAEAADLGVGRCSEQAVAQAKQVTRHVDRRLAFSGDQTVVALAGATGSGKSSLFNAVSGTQLARCGVRRPTTEATTAACWGTVPADLLAWLGVSERHVIAKGDARFDGLVLLDLPDHDSIRSEHRDEVDRLVKLVDGIIWVLDPQKYADNALHERYLRPLAPYADVMLVVLNQCDLMGPDDLAVAMADLRRLLDDDGLAQATLTATSAMTGQGIDELRQMVANLVVTKQVAVQRLSTDVSQAAKGFVGDVRRDHRREITGEMRSRLYEAMDGAAGLPEVVRGVAQITRQRGAAATGWPLVAWVNSLKPDPLRRLRGSKPGGVIRLPGIGGAVAQAQLASAMRQLGLDLTAGLTPGWASAIQDAATGRGDDLPSELDKALARVDLGVDQPMRWWRVIRVVQWVLIAVVVAGIVWAAAGGLDAGPSWHGLGVPAALMAGGVVAGLLVALICHAAVAASARRRASQISTALRAQVAQVADEQVLHPVHAELERYARFVACVARAL